MQLENQLIKNGSEETKILNIGNATNQERLAMGFPLWEKGKPERTTPISFLPALTLKNGVWTPIPTYSHRVARRDRKYHTRNAWLKSPERKEIIEARKRHRENKPEIE